MKKILCFTVILCMLLGGLSVTAKEYSFDDMAEFLNGLDILHGDASKGGDYDFYSYLTRAQFAKIAVAASKYKNSVPIGTNTSPYSDVPRTHWAAGYIKVAATNKLVTGYPDSTFRPDATVLLEEAVTIALKLLGYENADFGGEWPYGQLGIANNLGLLDNVSAAVGNPLNRLDAIVLMYNTLNSDTKSGSNYLSSLGYQLTEDVVLVSSSNEDPSIDSDKVVTSTGTYKVAKNFDFSKIGEKGDILLKNGKEIVKFFGNGRNKTSYVVMGVLSDDIIVSDKGSTKVLDLTDDTEVYYNNTKMTASSLTSKLKMGDSVSVMTDDKGQIKHVVAQNQVMEGPLRVTSLNILDTVLPKGSEATLIKGGRIVDVSSLAINDIIYYSKAMNTVWAYSDKRVGVYEDAIPNQEAPSQIIVSGITYEIESAEAFSKLSSTGSYKLGQSITLLFGKNGKIADVLSSGDGVEEVIGLAVNSGTKEFTLNNEKYSAYYLTVVTPDGNQMDYETSYLYDLKGKIVKLTFKADGITASAVSTGGISGTYSYNSGTLGSMKVAANVQIIDAKETMVSEVGGFTKIYPSRIDGVEFSSKDILYYSKNKSGEIDRMILNDITGENYQYGMIIEAAEIGGTSYLINGTTKSTGTYFTAKPKTFGRFDMKNNQLSGFQAIPNVDKVTELTLGYLKDSNGKTYTLSDNIQVYRVDYGFNYNLTTLSDAVDNFSKYTVSAYYDKSDNKGGRVRILVLR